jgi:hypothetical protein
MHDQDGKHDAENRSDREAEQRGRERDPGVVGKVARGIERIFEDRLVKVLRHLMRRRYHRPFEVHRSGDDVGEDVGLLLALEGIAHERGVHQHGGQVPQRDQNNDDDRDRRMLDKPSRAPIRGRDRHRAGRRLRATRHGYSS